ncbi:unnamed protein product [Caenorhabditis auriculariae]|uniref:SUI1 domain-containing protein n=1 Tax=Caenorhabditis auriculariae TaxID=2777116 RepID=A0A8S1HPH4_9PELO|nr:unnamed protein product [Caenorhabditis auriculariae]
MSDNAEGDVAVVRPCLAPGPTEGVNYPLKVHYCGECSMPMEYCDYSGRTEACRTWATTHAPEALEGLSIDDNAEENEKKHQKRGGKGTSKPKDKKKSDWRLQTFEIDLKVATKLFAQKFACGSSVTGADEIVIQGDVKDDLFDLLPSKWPQITDDSIEDLGDKKR